MKSIHKSLFLLFLLAVSININAQDLNHVQGEILIKLWPEESLKVQDWIEKFETFNGRNSQITYKKQVSKAMDIHAVTFDHNSIKEGSLLRAMRKDRSVQAAQFNHFVNLRSTIPNDPGFQSQWQYINTGQNGGTVGADIDMDLAWDVATGGLTPDGDTIVSCIIDNGVNLNHPDLVSNLWKNHAEIPNNGIDDDGNGFVDDFHGWDTGSDSDEVGDGGGHGTPVTGIIGAIGNNGVGVAGVNWNVKLMIVQGGSGVESEVLEAYSYPYIARKRYNETNGQEGAFVVSTNASWGIDQGQPADAPLWCSFYDSLGVQGIINCGATANANFDIDAVGDLPTACSSEYLISVTNMNRNDVKVNGAGYGLETIDLGAFGAETWTTSFNNYGPFGGTSGATPHVTGALALLYSAPCPTLIAIAKGDPSEGARLVRDYILHGVDPNGSLDGITVTGGRLNVANAMNDLMGNCGPCPPPSNITTTDLIDVSTTISWNNNDSIQMNNLLWRPVGSTNWNTEVGATSPFSLTGLTACTFYEVQVMGICSSDTSYTANFEFKTDGCCENPSTFFSTDIGAETVTANWSSIFAANNYSVRISVAGMNDWDVIEETGLSYTFNDLMPCTDYEIQIQVNCGAATNPDYSESILFRTRGCGACIDLTYCSPDDDSDSGDEWIDAVVVGPLSNNSGNNGNYGDFSETGPSGTFATFQSYDIVLTPGFSGTTFNEGWGIWIDLNQDGDFSDNGEQVYQSNGISSEVIMSSITIPGGAVPGLTRMRISMEYDGSASVCSNSSNFGEMEDYCITIEEGTPICDTPDNLSVSNIAAESATLNWDEIAGVDTYMIQYKEVSAATFIEENATQNTYNLDGLAEQTTYEFQVQALCNNNLESELSEKFTFTTSMASSLANDLNVENLLVYPNPFNEELVVEMEGLNQASEWQIQLIDQLGRQMTQRIVTPIANNSSKTILPTSALASGIYFLKIIDDAGNSLTKRIVKTTK